MHDGDADALDQASASYTEQLIAQLREARLVKTKHGPGGYYLTGPADRITVADVFRVFDEPRTLDGRAFAPQALTQSEIAELSVPISFGRRLTATSCCSWRGSLSPTLRRTPTGRCPIMWATMREAPA